MLQTVPATKKSVIKDKRKQELIDATIESIYRHGLEKTTISRVTEVAGLSVGIVNFHFEGKEQLLLGVLTSIRDEFERAFRSATHDIADPRQTLDRVTQVHFDPAICSPQKIAVWHAFAAASRTREDYNRICGELDDTVRDLIETSIRALCGDSARDERNPVALARGLEGLLDTCWQECLYSPDRFDPENAVSLCRDYLDSLFGAVSSGETDRPAPLRTPAGATESDLLPRWTYRNPAFFQREREQLFKPAWMLVGHVNDAADAGDFLTFNGFGERAIVIRGRDGGLRAFHNVCRHRGASLRDEAKGRCDHALSCPFHGWTYDLEGKLIAVPARDTFDDLDLGANGLVPLEMEIWMGFIFIRFRSGGPSLAETLAPVTHLVEPYRIEDMVALPGTDYRELRPYNWKVIHDIDNEGYHVPVGHPALQQLYGRTYRDEAIGGIPVSSGTINEKPARNWAVRHYQKLLPDFPHLPADNQRLWLYVGIFPNMVIGMYPESVEFYMTLPDQPDSTWYLGRSYGLPDARREVRAARYLSRRINDVTEGEDESFVRAMQDGLDSSAFPEQILSSREQGVRHFHKEIQTRLPVARLASEPSDDIIADPGFQLVK